MEPLTFTCPACGRLLRYEPEQAGDPYECPDCGGRGTLPPMRLAPLDEEPSQEAEDEGPATVALEGGDNPSLPPRAAEEQLLWEEAARRAKKRKLRRSWRPVHRGLTVLLFSWLAVTLLATVLLLGVTYRWLQILFPLEGASISQEGVGVFGILFFLAESAGLYGYRLCLQAPKDQGIRDWARVAFGLAAVRNVACLSASVAYLLVSADARLALGVFTIVAAGLFFGQWFVGTLMLRAIAHSIQSQWLMQMAWTEIFLLGGAVLGLSAILCAYFSFAGGSPEGFAELGVVEGAWLRLFVGCGGAVLLVVLWLAAVWRLRLLNFLRGSIEA